MKHKETADAGIFISLVNLWRFAWIQHRHKKSFNLQAKCDQKWNQSILRRENWPILDSMLVNMVRMLKANSSAKALFLATATPSPGSSNLCSTQACHTITDIQSVLKSPMFKTIELYLCLHIFSPLKRWIQKHSKSHLQYHAVQQLALKLEQELLEWFQFLFRNGKFSRVMMHRLQ